MADSFTITRILQTPRDLVWDTWTRPEHFSVWFGTDEVDVPLDTVTMDVRVGGALVVVMAFPDGTTIRWHGEYTEVTPPERLAFSLSDVPDDSPGIPIVATFAEVHGETEVSVTQAVEDFTEEQIEATIVGYNSFFDSLERLLARLRAGA
jgi:uncharacterized protein YndB with AHSA1/START domain